MQNKEKSVLLKGIKTILSIFEDNNINYLILRNYGFLASNDKNFDDLDILIKSEQFSQAKKIFFKEKFKKRNEVFYKYVGHDRFLRIHPRSEKNFIEHLIYPKPQQLFLNKKREKFFYKLSNEDYLISLIAHAILGKRKVQEKYINEYQTLISSNLNFQYIENVLDNAFGKNQGKIILSSIRNQTFQNLNLKKHYLNFLLKEPLKSIKIISKRKLSKYTRLFKGSLICFIGPDGSGKTTLLEETHKSLKQPLTLQKEIIHFGSPVKSRIYRSIDLPLKILRTYFNIISGKVTFTDRYIYLTFRRKPLLNKIVKYLAPTPSAIFLAKAPPELVRKRRKELTLHQISQLYSLYEKIPNITQIDTSLPIHKCKDLILQNLPLEYK